MNRDTLRSKSRLSRDFSEQGPWKSGSRSILDQGGPFRVHLAIGCETSRPQNLEDQAKRSTKNDRMCRFVFSQKMTDSRVFSFYPLVNPVRDPRTAPATRSRRFAPLAAHSVARPSYPSSPSFTINGQPARPAGRAAGGPSVPVWESLCLSLSVCLLCLAGVWLSG